MNLKKKNLIFIVTFICLNLLSFLIFKYYKEQINIKEISNNAYSLHSIRINEKDLYKHEKFINEDLRVFLEFNDDIRVVYSLSKGWSPSIGKGRFFQPDEKGNKAVIGSDYLDSIKRINDKGYISMFGIEFEVIGIIQEDFVSRLDSLIFLNPEKIPDFDVKSVVIDSNYKSSIHKFTSEIKKENNYVNNIEIELNELNKSMQSDFFNRLIIVTTILLIFVSIIAFINYWFEINVRYFNTQFLLGVSYRKIKNMFLKNIIINISISNILSILFMIKADIKFIVIVLISSLIISSITAMLLITKWIKYNNIRRGEELKYVKGA